MNHAPAFVHTATAPARDTIGLLGNRLRMVATAHNPPEEAVWLAASLHPPANSDVREIGCGTGAASLCLAFRRPDITVTGIDIQPALITLAQHNAALNTPLFKPPHFKVADVFNTPARTYAHVFANPPFHWRAQGHQTTALHKELAHITLNHPAVWVGALLQHTHASLTLVHHASHAGTLCHLLTQKGFSVNLIYLATQRANTPKRVIISATHTPQQYPTAQSCKIFTHHPHTRHRVLYDGQGL